MEQLAKAGPELAVEAGAADLEQEIGATAGPTHLLRFVHAAVDQEVRGSFGERCADPQTGAMAFGIGSMANCGSRDLVEGIGER